MASGTYLHDYATAVLCGDRPESVGCDSGPGAPENNPRHVAVITQYDGGSIYVAALPK